jgi:hypothetical protein
MLQDFVTEHRDAIIAACRIKVDKRTSPPASPVGADHGVPMFLDQLVNELQVGLSESSQIATTARFHGDDLMRQGYTISQVVHCYGDVCQAITEMALQLHAAIPTGDFQLLNRCLDEAIAAAVTMYGESRDRHVDREAAAESDRVAALASDLRRLIRTSRAALDVITSGSVGLSGSTGALLQQSLVTAGDVTLRLLDEVSARRPKHDAVQLPDR